MSKTTKSQRQRRARSFVRRVRANQRAAIVTKPK